MSTAAAAPERAAGRRLPVTVIGLVVLVISLALTVTLSVTAYRLNRHNEHRLLDLQVKQTATVLQTSLPAVETPLASAAHEHEGEEHAEEESGEEHAHEGEEHAEEEHDHGGLDPHVWLDPTQMATITGAVRDQLSALDPDHAAHLRRTLAQVLTACLDFATNRSAA